MSKVFRIYQDVDSGTKEETERYVRLIEAYKTWIQGKGKNPFEDLESAVEEYKKFPAKKENYEFREEVFDAIVKEVSRIRKLKIDLKKLGEEMKFRAHGFTK